jgi:hypothetical protein
MPSTLLECLKEQIVENSSKRLRCNSGGRVIYIISHRPAPIFFWTNATAGRKELKEQKNESSEKIQSFKCDPDWRIVEPN